MKLFENNGADFSKCKNYRFSLWRIWDEEKPKVAFIGLNPSKANTEDNDPTITRVIAFAKRWGYGGVYMFNCFPFVSTDPGKLHVGEYYFQNLHGLKASIEAHCDKVVFSWGNFKVVKEHKIDDTLSLWFPDAVALQINKNGSPKHPLYVKGDIEPVKYKS